MVGRAVLALVALVAAVTLAPLRRPENDAQRAAAVLRGLPVLVALVPLLAAATRWGGALTWTAAGAQRRPRERTVA